MKTIPVSEPVTNGPLGPRRAATGRLHSPTRETLLRILEAQSAPTSIAALARTTGWHPNTVRGHVHALWHDGYVERTREAPGRRVGPTSGGRPSWLWSVKDRAPGSAYAALAGVLAETVARISDDPQADALVAGRRWGVAVGAGEAEAPDADRVHGTVVRVLRDQGFAPEELTDGTIALRQCPLIEAATRHSDVVCAVHRGMVIGVLEAIGSRDAGTELVPFDAPGRCTLRLRVAQ